MIYNRHICSLYQPLCTVTPSLRYSFALYHISLHFWLLPIISYAFFVTKLHLYALAHLSQKRNWYLDRRKTWWNNGEHKVRTNLFLLNELYFFKKKKRKVTYFMFLFIISHPSSYICRNTKKPIFFIKNDINSILYLRIFKIPIYEPILKIFEIWYFLHK